MKRFLLFASVAAASILGWWMLKNSNSNSQPHAPTEQQTTATIPQPIGPSSHSPGIRHHDPDATTPADTSWREKLLTLQAETNELFGATGEDHMRAMQDFSESISASALPTILRELQVLQEQKPTIAGHDLEMRLLKHWAENDPGSAAAWANTVTGDSRPEALAAAASLWARKDFSDAATWANQLPGLADQQSALKSVATEGLYSNPTDALKMAAQLPADAERDDLIARAAGVWASTAPADATAYVKQLPDDNARKQAIATIAMAWADKDPVAAGNLAVNSLPPGKIQEDAVFAVLRRWSLQDRQAAEAWVAQFPNGELRTLATKTLANDSVRLSAVVPTD